MVAAIAPRTVPAERAPRTSTSSDVVVRPPRPESPERWTRALARALAAGIDALEVGGSTMWAVESQSRPGTVFLVDAEARTCTCEAAAGGDPVCCHRALARFLAGALALPVEMCPTCAGAGCLGVGWSLGPDVVGCHDCRGRGEVEVTVAAFLASIPTAAEARRGQRGRAATAA